jgi:hypothetical protein
MGVLLGRFGTQELTVEIADAVQAGDQFMIIAELLADRGDLMGAEGELFDAAAGVADGKDPERMALAASADGAAGGVADMAVEQGAAEDLGEGGQGGGEFGAGGQSVCLCHYYIMKHTSGGPSSSF